MLRADQLSHLTSDVIVIVTVVRPVLPETDSASWMTAFAVHDDIVVDAPNDSDADAMPPRVSPYQPSDGRGSDAPSHR